MKVPKILEGLLKIPYVYVDEILTRLDNFKLCSPGEWRGGGGGRWRKPDEAQLVAVALAAAAAVVVVVAAAAAGHTPLV